MMKLKLCLWLTILMMRADSASQEPSDTDAELIERLEKSLLASFGLDERPKVDKSQVKIPPYMMHLYNQKVKHNLEESEHDEEREGRSMAFASSASPYIVANTVRSFTHLESAEDRFQPLHQMLLRFNVSSVPKREILQGAEVRIMHVQHPSIPLGSSSASAGTGSQSRRRWSKKDIVYLQRIRVYDVLRPARGPLPHIHRLLDSRIIDARVSDTAKLDVAAALKRWLNKPHTNHGLFIEVVPATGTSSPSSSSSSPFSDAAHVRLRRDVAMGGNDAEWSEQQPLLVVHTDDPNIKPRKRRSSSSSLTKRVHSHCRKYNLYVDFRKVDWNTWIVAPPGYDAFFCQGACPFPLAKHMNATNHAVIQNIIHSRYPNRVPSACCVPIKHSAISMLYLDKDRKVVLKTYQDMIVESCGCQ